MYRTDSWTLWEKTRVGCFERTADIENGLVDTVGGKRGWGELREHH